MVYQLGYFDKEGPLVGGPFFQLVTLELLIHRIDIVTVDKSISVLTDWAVHSLFICSKKILCGQGSLVFFEQMNNLQTVARLGVDKFTSHVRRTQSPGGCL